MAIEKDEELFKLQEQVEPIEPGSLTTFGNSVKENLTVFGTRIGAIMDGSSEDGWDDKVKTQNIWKIRCFFPIFVASKDSRLKDLFKLTMLSIWNYLLTINTNSYGEKGVIDRNK